ncbi:hypothetical protein [Flavobacterium haoranii]|uniref:Uncharacterized protein n=1 Tax=Flavobacterium haoranii TaxID=683124 RepID=A0A1M6HRZ4_9FLAO|nr:hypothetical protein [Flavobacterium haoranii]SHJ24947.1 hypothetical protein SAMN05444337_1626 [Flavobacterium haoranii]
MFWFSICLLGLAVFTFFSIYFEWEFLKKEWAKGIPYSNFDKFIGYLVSLLTAIFAFILLYNSIF